MISAQEAYLRTVEAKVGRHIITEIEYLIARSYRAKQVCCSIDLTNVDQSAISDIEETKIAIRELLSIQGFSFTEEDHSFTIYWEPTDEDTDY